MVTNGDQKTNNFGKLVRQKVGLFSSWFSARRAAGGAPPHGRRSATAVQDAGREQRRARRLGSDAFGDKGARKQATSTVPLSTRVQPCQAEKRIHVN